MAYKYADDTTVLFIIYDPTTSGDLARAKRKLAEYFAELRAWALKNPSLLNDGKTDYLFVLSKHHLKKIGVE